MLALTLTYNYMICMRFASALKQSRLLIYGYKFINALVKKRALLVQLNFKFRRFFFEFINEMYKTQQRCKRKTQQKTRSCHTKRLFCCFLIPTLLHRLVFGTTKPDCLWNTQSSRH